LSLCYGWSPQELICTIYSDDKLAIQGGVYLLQGRVHEGYIIHVLTPAWKSRDVCPRVEFDKNICYKAENRQLKHFLCPDLAILHLVIHDVEPFCPLLRGGPYEEIVNVYTY